MDRRSIGSSGVTRTPLQSVLSPVQRTGLTSSLGKRAAGEAGLENGQSRVYVHVPKPMTGVSSESYAVTLREVPRKDDPFSRTDPATTRRALWESQRSENALKRQIMQHESTHRENERRMEELVSENERLRNERRILLEGETMERETGEQREGEWGKERVRLQTASVTDAPDPDGRSDSELASSELAVGGLVGSSAIGACAGVGPIVGTADAEWE